MLSTSARWRSVCEAIEGSLSVVYGIVGEEYWGALQRICAANVVGML